MNFSSDKIKNDNYNLRKSAVLQVLNEENGLFSYSKIRTKSIDKLEKEFKSSNNNIIKNHRVDENILDKCITLFRRSMSLHVCDWVGKNENSNNMKLNLMSEFENDGVSFDESNFQFESYLHRFKELSNYRLND